MLARISGEVKGLRQQREGKGIRKHLAPVTVSREYAKAQVPARIGAQRRLKRSNVALSCTIAERARRLNPGFAGRYQESSPHLPRFTFHKALGLTIILTMIFPITSSDRMVRPGSCLSALAIIILSATPLHALEIEVTSIPKGLLRSINRHLNYDIAIEVDNARGDHFNVDPPCYLDAIPESVTTDEPLVFEAFENQDVIYPLKVRVGDKTLEHFSSKAEFVVLKSDEASPVIKHTRIIVRPGFTDAKAEAIARTLNGAAGFGPGSDFAIGATAVKNIQAVQKLYWDYVQQQTVDKDLHRFHQLATVYYDRAMFLKTAADKGGGLAAARLVDQGIKYLDLANHTLKDDKLDKMLLTIKVARSEDSAHTLEELGSYTNEKVGELVLQTFGYILDHSQRSEDVKAYLQAMMMH